MKKHTLLLAAVLMVPMGSVSMAQEDKPAGDRTAEQILKDYQSVKPPVFEGGKQNDQTYIQSYMDQRRKTMERKAELAWELYQKDPNHERAVPLLNERWSTLAMTGSAEKVLAETQQVLASLKDESRKGDVLYARAQAMLMDYSALQKDSAPALAASEDFIKAKPADERGAFLLMRLSDVTREPAAKKKMLERIRDEYKDSRVAKVAEGTLRQVEGLGKPFEVSFSDAISGNNISMAGLKGKVVVVDFWATWCGPCVVEMPHMKELYAQYKDKGVEFIGISLDAPEAQGGLKKLKEFCAEKEIAWPQYYQGNGWDSEFSKSWGINAIPRLFIVDAEGKLHSTEARGKLDTLIPELIKQRDEKKVSLAH